MTHHPMIAPSPFYAIIGKGDMQRGCEDTREIFADNGISCMLRAILIFTIFLTPFQKRQCFYDVSCGSLIGCPPVMRTVTLDPRAGEIRVDTQVIKDVPGLDTAGKPFDEYMKGFFFGMIGEVIWAMGNDINRLAELTPAFSIPGEKVKSLRGSLNP